MADIVRDIIRDVLELAGVDVTISTAIEPHVRQKYGGERYYIGRSIPEKKTLTVGSAYAMGMTTRQIADTYGMPERTVRWHGSRRLYRS